VQVVDTGKDGIKEAMDVVVLSYSLVGKYQGNLEKFGFVICDESHYLKSTDS
jgi:hypothetical protein